MDSGWDGLSLRTTFLPPIAQSLVYENVNIDKDKHISAQFLVEEEFDGLGNAKPAALLEFKKHHEIQ